jgi:hypothetical protein
MRKQYSKTEAFNTLKRRKTVLEIQTLYPQSLKEYALKKDTIKGVYFIERTKDKKRTQLMVKDEAENFILYGLSNNECLTLKFE